jgi:hypothetical protein
MTFMQSAGDEPPRHERSRAGRLLLGSAGTAVTIGVLALGTGAAWAAPAGTAPACHHHGGGGGTGGSGGGGHRHGHHHHGGGGTGGGGSGGGGGTHGGGGAPPGNNGTIKIDQTVLVPSGKVDHANHPHVSCQFALSFFGYDTGTDTAQVTFTAQPPSGKFTPVAISSGPSALSFTVPRRTGGGQLDDSVPYSLDVSGLKEGPQGYHIRVTVDVSGAKNADSKTKVFWYTPCAPAQGGTGSSGGSGSGTGSTGAGSGSGSGSGAHSSAPGTASLTSAGSGRTAAPVASAPTGDSPAVAGSGGALPTGAATDLGRFAPSSPVAPAGGIEWWEVMAGIALAAAASGTVVVGRARKRARA